MSTNITSLKIKQIHLALPLTFDFQVWLGTQGNEAGVKWCKDGDEGVQANLAKNTWKLPLFGHEISGTIEGSLLLVTDIKCRSEGSSHIWSDVILPLFEQCNGTLSALVVWQDGSVYRTTVQDGKVTEVEVE